MDNRLYFVLGDLFANIIVGLLVGGLSWLIVSTGWNMWLAMVLMMAVGMLAALILWIPVGIQFGAIEAMVPAMLSGMLSGMVLGMWCAMVALSGTAASAIGGVCGLVGIVFIWVANNSLRGISASN